MLYSRRSNNPIIEIILLTYNNLFNTKKCIEHLYQNTSDFGITIFDNNSDDETDSYLFDLIKKYNNITLYMNEENVGIIKGRNDAYRISSYSENESKYVFFLDNDQYVQEGWLESYLELIKKGYDLIGIEAWKMKKDYYPYKKITDINDGFNYVGCGGMMIKQEVVKKIGLFDEIFSPKYFEDPNFCFMANKAGYKIGWNDKPVIIHNHEGPLLNKETKRHFMISWDKFKQKWEGTELPVFKM